MNKITKIAVSTSIVSLILLGIVLVSGASHPDYLFTYGTAAGLILMFTSLLLFAVGWGRDFFIAVKQNDKHGILILVVAAVLFILPILVKYGFR